jgi:ABC-type transporter Mla maintaining outer membrane lipid asymmetry permease subunit MlaE
VLLLSFAGPVIRPAATVLSGVGIGLFIDEIGKFVTSDNDHFYRPAATLRYVFVASLVLAVHLLHGRRAHRPAEHLGAAVDQTADACSACPERFVR